MTPRPRERYLDPPRARIIKIEQLWWTGYPFPWERHRPTHWYSWFPFDSFDEALAHLRAGLAALRS